MKAKILTIDGKSKGEINLPKSFSAPVREDVVQKVLEIKKTKQPYGPNSRAGNYSASGKIVHRRHVWKSQYGRGMSRIPRKIFSRKGSQFTWEGATIPSTRGGRRAHPPKPGSMVNTRKVNKKECEIAFESALSATADKKFVERKYAGIKKLDKEVPFVVDSKIASLKTKEFLKNLGKILGEKLSEIAIKKKSIRAGIGKLRGRKYKKSAGTLLVVGENEKIKIGKFDVVNVKNLGVNDLAKGGLGRLTIYTEEAIKFLGGKK
ncbi:50S ribosomal protein L4 [Candidatus Pacearchaeota archaeon]|jgi:large subunit ribosomal protein L4e|nr:50S ribosomal protein L4 [Candidatus Pacearchaeota archaeon]|tara:strand:+ start:238 stop:1026 length:789 start_codon:yes stop_codon:yes gene_type:complete